MELLYNEILESVSDTNKLINKFFHDNPSDDYLKSLSWVNESSDEGDDKSALNSIKENYEKGKLFISKALEKVKKAKNIHGQIKVKVDPKKAVKNVKDAYEKLDVNYSKIKTGALASLGIITLPVPLPTTEIFAASAVVFDAIRTISDIYHRNDLRILKDLDNTLNNIKLGEDPNKRRMLMKCFMIFIKCFNNAISLSITLIGRLEVWTIDKVVDSKKKSKKLSKEDKEYFDRTSKIIKGSREKLKGKYKEVKKAIEDDKLDSTRKKYGITSKSIKESVDTHLSYLDSLSNIGE